jgi:hypothetical protein
MVTLDIFEYLEKEAKLWPKKHWCVATTRGQDTLSVTDRLSPSGDSQLRWRSRPVTITRSPLPMPDGHLMP